MDPALEARPPMEQEMHRDALDAFDEVEGLMVYQHLQWLEEIVSCWEVRNRYKISALPKGNEYRDFENHEFENMPTMFEAREDSSICCRLCCANNREFKLGLFPPDVPRNPRWPDTPSLLTIDRPFRCSICCFCCMLNPQEVQVTSGAGQDLGKVICDWRFIDCCFKCTCWAKSFDSVGNHVHSFRTSCCGENCCAPTCCNKVFTIYVLDKETEKKPLGVFRNIFPGWNWRGLCSQSASNLVVVFPKEATKEEKGLLLGSLFLHDFMLFEKTNDNNNN
eukprot:g1343.t1